MTTSTSKDAAAQRSKQPLWLLLLSAPLLILAMGVIVVLFLRANAVQQADSTAINFAGRQRMLNQRHIKEVLLASEGKVADYRATQELFIESLRVLRDGGQAVIDSQTGETRDLLPILVAEIREKMDEQEQLFDEQVEAADQLLALERNEPGRSGRLETLLNSNQRTHEVIEDGVQLLEERSKKHVVLTLKWAVTGAAVLFLMGAALLVQTLRVRRLHRGIENEAQEKKHSLEQLNAVVESTVDGIISIDLEGRILSFNSAASKIFGYELSEVLGKNVSLLIPEPHHSKHDGYMKDYLRTGKAKILGIGREVDGQRKDGTIFPIDLSVNEVRVADPHIFVGVLRDITDRKQFEKELRQSVERFDLAVAGSTDGIWDWDVPTNAVYYSPRFKQLLGYEDHEIENQFASFESRLHADDREPTLQAVRAHLEERVPYDVEYRLRTKSGAYRWFRARGQALWGEDGGATRMSGSITDVTEAKRADELLETEAFKAKLLHRATTLAAETDSLEDALQNCVDTVCEMTGWPVGHVYLPDAHRKDELVPTGIWHPEGGHDYMAFKETTERTNFRRGIGLPGRIWESGEPAWIVDVGEDANFPRARLSDDLGVKGAFGFPIKIRNETVAILEFFADRQMHEDKDLLMMVRSLGEQVGRVLERKRAEAELRLAKEQAEAANVAKSRFLANMSHELRTPLNSVIGFSNILRKNKAGNLTAEDTSFLKRILDNGKHLLMLINDLLDLAKVESGQMQLQTSTVQLELLIRQTIGELEGQIDDGRLKLIVEVPPDVQPLELDGDKLKQVLINLVGNAIKFTKRGSIRVAVGADEDTGRPRWIEVADTGVGILKERQQAIFEAFQQADDSTSREYGGTGLGLSISRSLLELMDCKLELESEVGKGSTFRIVLPADAATAEVEAGTDLPEHGGSVIAGGVRQAAHVKANNLLVLVIDDEWDSRTVLTQYLQDLGCRVLPAATGEEGLRIAREHKPDLITLDLMMPNKNGWEVLTQIKADPALRNIPVTVVSIVASEKKDPRFEVVDFLDKPVSRAALLETLSKMLRSRPRRVLVVEDDEDASRILCSYLEDQNLEIRTAANGLEALRALETSKSDIVVLDLIMPVMDGWTFLRDMRSMPQCADLPVVVVTAKALDSEETRALEKKVFAVLRKGDLLQGHLRRALDEALRGRRTESRGQA